MSDAWLLDAYAGSDGVSIVAWIRKRNGSTVRRVVPFAAPFYVKPTTRPLGPVLEALEADGRVRETWTTERRLSLQTPAQPVLAVVPHRFVDARAIVTDLQKTLGSASYHYYDTDIEPPSRWMHARGLFPFCRLAREAPEWKSDDERYALDYELPPLRSANLHVETDPATGQIAAVEFAGERLEATGDERMILVDLDRLAQRHDPDFIITHGGDARDLPLVMERVRANGLAGRVRLGRDPDPRDASQKPRSYWTYGRVVYRSQGWLLRGRFHVDTEKKFLPTSDERTNVHGLIYLSRISNCSLQRVARNSPGYCIQQMQIDAALDQGVSVSWKRNLVEGWKTAITLTAVDRGGQIHVPTPGIYGDVWACDFSSYYPSLIVHRNLSSETINCSCCPDSRAIIPDLGMHVCQRVQGHQAHVLAPLMVHRRYVKAILKHPDADEERKAWARAIKEELKGIGVVCFGYARYKFARFGCAEVHQAIQAYGREGMTNSKTTAEKMGFEVIHGLTDCLFFRKPGATRANLQRLTRRIGLEVGVPMDIEAHFDWVVFLPSKTHPGIGVPNRYYGRKDDGKLKVRGIEVRRHSTPPLLVLTQEDMLARMAQERTPEAVTAAIPHVLEIAKTAAGRILRGEVPAADLALSLSTTRGVDEYQQTTALKVAMRKLRAAGISVQPGQTVQLVVQRGDPKLPWEQRATPLALLDKPGPFGAGAPYDRAFYVRHLARSVETILSPFGVEEDPLARWLAGHAVNSPASPRPTPPLRGSCGRVAPDSFPAPS